MMLVVTTLEPPGKRDGRAAHNAGQEVSNFEYVSGMNKTDESTHS